jgi:hypothetical protein
MMFLPIQANAVPITGATVGVDGRILTAQQAGDTSGWIEIAQNSGFSLIVRQNCIQLMLGLQPESQYISYGATSSYGSSSVRTKINDWFMGTSKYGENLPNNARLRDYTVTNNALSCQGSGIKSIAKAGGISMPTA